MDGFLKKMLMGGGVTLVSLLAVKLMAIVNSVIAARLLQPSDFGALSIVVNLQNLVVIVACFGVPLAVTKHVSQWRSKDESFASAVASALLAMLLISSAVTAIGYLLLSRTIAEGIYSNPRLVEVLQLSAAYVLIASVNLGMSGLLRGCQRISTLAKVNTAIALVAQPITYAAIYLEGLNGAIVAMIIANAISVALFLVTVRGIVHLSLKGANLVLGRRRAIRPLLTFTIPSFLIGLIVVPAYWVGRTELALHWDLFSVGQFQIAESLSQLVLLVPTAVSVPLLPLISEQEDMLTVGKSSGSLLRLAVFLGVPSSLLILPFLRSVIAILYGSDYAPANDTAVLMFASSTFIALGTVISSTIIGVGRMWAALALDTLWLTCFLSSVFLLVPSSGKEGLAGAYATSYLVYLFMLVWYFRTRFKVDTTRLVPLVAAYVPAMMLYLLYVSPMGFAIRFLYGAGLAAVFLAIGFAFVLEKEERLYFGKVLRRL